MVSSSGSPPRQRSAQASDDDRRGTALRVREDVRWGGRHAGERSGLVRILREASALDAAGEAWVAAVPPWTGWLVSPESARAGSGRLRGP